MRCVRGVLLSWGRKSGGRRWRSPYFQFLNLEEKWGYTRLMTAIELFKNSPDAKELANEIGSDPEIMDGLPIFTGTRIPVYIVLDYLAEGFSLPEIKKDFPSMDDKKIKAALKFAGLLSTLH